MNIFARKYYVYESVGYSLNADLTLVLSQTNLEIQGNFVKFDKF